MQSFESVCKTDLKNFIRNTIGETKIYSYRKSLSLSRQFHCRAFSWNLCKISLKSKKFQPACTIYIGVRSILEFQFGHNPSPKIIMPPKMIFI